MGGVCEGEFVDESLEKALTINKYKNDPQYEYAEQSNESRLNLKKLMDDREEPPQDYAQRAPSVPSINKKISSILAKLQMEPLKSGQTKGLILPPYELVKYPGYFYMGEWMAKRPHGRGKIVSTDSYTQGYFNKGELSCRDGIKIWSNGCYYRGEFNNFSFSGTGSYHNTVEKSSYEGEWLNNKPHGKGKEVLENEKTTYVGQFYEGKRQGEGELHWQRGVRNHYKGYFRNGRMNGMGTLTQGNTVFKGKFEDDVKISGELITQNYVYCGRFLNDLPQDLNGYYRNRSDGIIYKGNFKAGKKQGHAVVTLPNQQTLATFWKDDQIVSMTPTNGFE